MNTLTTRWMVGMTVGLLGASAWAQSEVPAANPGRGSAGLPPALAVLDTDGDGRLSEAELARAGEVLRALDRDGDGAIDADELRGWRPSGVPGLGRGALGDRTGRSGRPGLGLRQDGPRQAGPPADRGLGQGRNRADRLQSDERTPSGPLTPRAQWGPQPMGPRGPGAVPQGRPGWGRMDGRQVQPCPCCAWGAPRRQGGGGWRGGPRG
ncbi:MAG: EF-hand domain-containing protein [Verrucomicrobiae bacterium]|nr:EF-hand domain-containing protein [Verrucomicrobiae bacterium]